MKMHTVTGHGGVRLHAREWGDPDAPPIVLIHGWSQHHVCWERQVASPLPHHYRLIAFDLRGHGASDKPEEEAAYDRTEPWAGDVEAVIDHFSLDQPLMVGWSMGGRIIGDYLSIHGDAALGGIVQIGSPATGGKFAPPEGVAMRGPAVNAEGAYSEDQAEALAAITAFVMECTAEPLPPEELAFMVGSNMFATPLARRASRVREYDHRPAWGAVTKPVMLIQGGKEKLAVPPNFRQMREALADPDVRIYEDDGHMPFWESPVRFNHDLDAFAKRCFGITE